MASNTRMTVAVLVVALLVVVFMFVSLFALDNSDDDGNPNTGGGLPAMRATLTNDGCTFDGDKSPTTGVFIIDVENQTEFSGGFVLLSLAEGSTVDDLQPVLDRYARRFERDGTSVPGDRFLGRSDVEAGATSALPANVSVGTYAVVCFVNDVPIEQVYIAAQLDVTE